MKIQSNKKYAYIALCLLLAILMSVLLCACGQETDSSNASSVSEEKTTEESAAETKMPVEPTVGLTYEYDGWLYGYVVSGMNEECHEHDIVIANEYNGEPVVGIKESAFKDWWITSVVIPDSVTNIGRDAFFGCRNLASVVIPDSVTSIGKSAFDDCSSLTSVVIGNSVKSIGDYAFYGCSSLTSIVIPDSVTSIGVSIFEECDSLQTIFCRAARMPDGWSGEWAKGLTATVEWGCKEKKTNLKKASSGNTNGFEISNGVLTKYVGNDAEVVIPDSVTGIGEGAFKGCKCLKDVYYTGSSTQWDSISIGFSWGNATIHYNYAP